MSTLPHRKAKKLNYPCKGCVHCADVNCPNYPGILKNEEEMTKLLYDSRRTRVTIHDYNSGNEIQINVASQSFVITLETARDLMAGLRVVLGDMDRAQQKKQEVDPY